MNTPKAGTPQQLQPHRPHVVRALLIDDKGELLIMRRDKPGRQPYYVFIGGGVEEGDASWRDAIKREVLEEVGAEITVGLEAYTLASDSVRGGQSVQHFFVCRLVSIDLSRRCGDEYRDEERGRYQVVAVSPSTEEFQAMNLFPYEVRDFVHARYSELYRTSLR